MILVDTGFFIALTSEKDEHHLSARHWMVRVTEPLVVTEFVLF